MSTFDHKLLVMHADLVFRRAAGRWRGVVAKARARIPISGAGTIFTRSVGNAARH